MLRSALQAEDFTLIAKLKWHGKRISLLLQRLRGSVALRGWRSTLARIAQEFHQRAATDQTLQLLPLDEPLAPFCLPTSSTPRVSVIVPVHGKLAYTLACLRSIAHHGADTPFEVMVVDDASPDDSAAALSQIEGLTLLRNTHNLGFVGSCNAAAATARGEFLCFLNNDTQVTPGWLDALLNCFTERVDCGIAGSRLVYPDGRLQEAGALMFADGSGWNLGRFEARDMPAYTRRRETDYVSAAALMIPAALFHQVGAFDPRYAPAYYEDADLAFAVRQAGLRVFFEPASTVVHYEGISAGTDPTCGMKRYQAINRQHFVTKWRAALTDQPAPGTPLPQAVDWHQRGRILVVDTMVPEPSRDSGSLRLCAILRLLDQQGWHTLFYPDDGYALTADVSRLGALGTELLHRPWLRDLPSWLCKHGHRLQAVILCRHTVASQYATFVRRHAPQAKLLFDTVDLHFLREQRAAELTGSAVLARQAAASHQSELALIAASEASFVVSPHEQELLKTLLPQARIELLSNIHEVHGCRQPHATRRDLVFIGGYGHPPNSDAIHWLANEILPRLREALPQIRLHLLGDLPTSVQRELRGPGLELHGRVDDLAPWLEQCLASLAPLRFGAGVKGKVTMAMSYGVPVVATPIAAEGMQLVDGENVLLANNVASVVDAVQRLQHDDALWQRLSRQGLDHVQRHFSAEAAAATLERVLS